MSETNLISILETDVFQKEIKKVALLNARGLVNNKILSKEDVEEFYITSGLKIIFRHLINDGIVRDRVESSFIEFSTLASTLGGSMLDAFTAVYERNPDNTPFKENVENNFKAIVEVLRANHLALLNHPAFMVEPKTMEVYISCLNKDEQNTTATSYSGDDKIQRSINQAKNLFNSLKESVKPNEDSKIALAEHYDVLKDLTVYINSSALNAVTYEQFVQQDLLQEYKDVSDRFDKGCDPLLTLHLFNHLLYNHFFVPKESAVLKTVFVSLPIVASSAELSIEVKKQIEVDKKKLPRNVAAIIENQSYKGLGALFLFMTLRSGGAEFDRVALDTLPFFIENIHKYCKSILSPVKDFVQGYGFETSKRLKEQIEKQATKAAISQVMARNMSHNIGSHVLSKFKNAEDVNQYLKAEIAEQISKIPGSTAIQDIQINKQYQAAALHLNKNLKGGELVAYFNEYLKNRMDFLADIATTDPTMETPMFFVKDMMSGLDRNRILLDRISGVSENIKFDFKVRRFINGIWEEITADSKYDTLISVPNDILGCQAFYIVIENIIRNIVKHSKHELDLDFVITVDIEDYPANQNYYKVFIYDNLFSKDKNEISELVESRNTAFNNNILEPERGQLRSGGLGTIEMKVCAAYLRKYSLTSIENELYRICSPYFLRIDSNENTTADSPQHSDYNIDGRGLVTPHLMYAYAQAYSEKELNSYSLGYTLFFRKPQTLLIIDDENKLKIDDNIKEGLRKNGIWILKQTDGGNHGYNSNTIYNHDFLIWLNDGAFSEFVNKNYGSLPRRILSQNIVGKDFKIDLDKPQDSINKIWELYGAHYFKKSAISIKILANEDKQPIIFPDSRDSQAHFTTIGLDFHGEKWARKNSEYIYYDLVCSHHKVNNMWDRLEDYKNILAQYAEMALTTVMIIDERIQHSILGTVVDPNSGKKYSKSGYTIPFRELFKKQNIFIPDFSEANLNVPNFGNLNSSKTTIFSDADKIRKYIHDNKDKCDFIVLHMGILEKLLPSGSDKSDTTINQLLDELDIGDLEDRKKIIITSGRGKPDNIPEDLRFVSLAILQNAIETLFDKFILVKLLYNSRKTKDN